MKTEARTELENAIFGIYINYINYFRGGVGYNPQPDPEARELASMLADGIFTDADLEGLTARLQSLLGRAVETGVYWALKIESGEAQLKDEWMAVGYRRPMRGQGGTKLERRLTEMAMRMLGEACPLTDDQDQRAMAALVSYIAEDIYEFGVPEMGAKPPVNQVALPILHRDIIITLIEVGVHLALIHIGTLEEVDEAPNDDCRPDCASRRSPHFECVCAERDAMEEAANN